MRFHCKTTDRSKNEHRNPTLLPRGQSAGKSAPPAHPESVELSQILRGPLQNRPRILICKNCRFMNTTSILIGLAQAAQRGHFPVG